jgi:hypothetical protein
MIKKLVKTLMSLTGYKIVPQDYLTTTRFGVDLRHDIKKIMADEKYQSHLLDQSFQTIFDVGANVGDTAIALVQHFPGATIYAFEPVSETFEKLEKRVEVFKEILPLNLGLGSQTEEKDIYIYSSASQFCNKYKCLALSWRLPPSLRFSDGCC